MKSEVALADGEFIDLRGRRTHVHRAGSGPAVVMIHGSGPGVTAWANWRLALPALAEAGYHAHAYDIVGFGYTERRDGEKYGIDAWIAQLTAYIEDVVGAPAMLVGNSLGGALALRFATIHPELVARLVLMGPAGVPFTLTPALDRVWGYTPGVESMRKLIAHDFAFDPSIATDDLVRLRYEASIQPGFQEAYAALFPAPRQQWVDAIVTPDAAIRGISVPTLIVHGRDDQVIPLENSLRLLHLIPNAQLHVFGQCGHWTQVEKARDFNALLIHFFR